jgi:hypothetical protein
LLFAEPILPPAEITLRTYAKRSRDNLKKTTNLRFAGHESFSRRMHDELLNERLFPSKGGTRVWIAT